MTRHLPALLLLLAVSGCPRSREEAPARVQAAARGPGEGRAAGTCSAAGLPATPPPATPPLPPAVEQTRRRIVAAAVRCDYAALGALAAEGSQGFGFTFGEAKDPAAFWRELEEVRHEPILARMVQVLGLPYVQQHGHYAWPSAHRENPSPVDWKVLETVYPPSQVEAFRQAGSYLGLRLAILPSGEWLFATSGD